MKTTFHSNCKLVWPFDGIFSMRDSEFLGFPQCDICVFCSIEPLVKVGNSYGFEILISGEILVDETYVLFWDVDFAIMGCNFGIYEFLSLNLKRYSSKHMCMIFSKYRVGKYFVKPTYNDVNFT